MQDRNRKAMWAKRNSRSGIRATDFDTKITTNELQGAVKFNIPPFIEFGVGGRHVETTIRDEREEELEAFVAEKKRDFEQENN